MAATTPVIVTGDDVLLYVTLKKNGATFAIDTGATVQARIINQHTTTNLTDAVEQVSTTAGADWDNSLVAVIFDSATTATIAKAGPARLEIQVDDGGKRTWFVNINIVLGTIS